MKRGGIMTAGPANRCMRGHDQGCSLKLRAMHPIPVCRVARLRLAALALSTVFLILGGPASAALGAYEHGAGIKSMGMGGIAVVGAEDSFPISINPAHAARLDERIDLGLDWVMVRTGGTIRDNLLGPDQSYDSHARNFPIPQFGGALRLDDRLWFGFSGLAAGFGTQYDESPLQRFTGEKKALSRLGLSGVSSALAYELTPQQQIGVALNLGLQLLEIEGLGRLAAFSEDPQHVSDQGRDLAASIGVSVGWLAQPLPGVEIGLSYRSPQWAERFDDYAGLLPDAGRFELPAIYGAGLSLQPFGTLRLALEWQRLLFGEEKASGNSVAQLAAGEQLGADDGPGFGWNNLTVYRIGLNWDIAPSLRVRIGYLDASQPTPARETLLGVFAANVTRRHYTAGFTHALGLDWEFSLYLTQATRGDQRGENSIPLLLGGGEADIYNGQRSIGVAFAYRFAR